MSIEIGLIPELSALADIEQLENKFFQMRGFYPSNISYWNPSGNISRQMEELVSISVLPSIIDYSFSYEIGGLDQLLAGIGLSAESKGILITPSGSTSILMVSRYLSKTGIDHVALLTPTYFTVPANLASEGIKLETHYLTRTAHGFQLPSTLNFKKVQVLWITNPIYCTGVSYNPKDIETFRNFLRDGGTIICDECLAWPSKELSWELGQWPGFIGIYSPHKGLCTNGIKYSFIVFPQNLQGFFDQWADALYGCLPTSSVAAIYHSVSEEFQKYRDHFKLVTDRARNFVFEAAEKYAIEMDISSYGYLISCYAPFIDQSRNVDIKFMEELIFESAASFIPGVRNHFDPAIGLCFRVNLARDDAVFRAAVVRIFQHLCRFR